MGRQYLRRGKCPGMGTATVQGWRFSILGFAQFGLETDPLRLRVPRLSVVKLWGARENC
jgi:hypothetical protein